MQIVRRLGVVLVGFLLCAGMVQAGDVAKLDFDWQFHLGEVKDGFAVNCPDKSWRTLDLPHDWSIEDLDAKTLMKETATDPEKTPRRVSGPFDSWAANGLSEAFTRGGTGWYRKHFSIPNTWKGKRILIQFDGVYMNADVWINGTHLGKHAYGYTSFTYDLTDHLKAAGESNVLAVEVKNVQPSSRWYAGSGIYRHVWLKAFDPVHVANWGVAVVTPNVSREWAKVDVAITVNNDTGERTDVEVETALVDPSGATIDQAVRQVRLGVALPGIVKHEFRVGLPKLWEPKTPWLYTAVTTVRRGGKVLDRQATPFGIRSIEFDARKGVFAERCADLA
jgi:beta-galactosidase